MFSDILESRMFLLWHNIRVGKDKEQVNTRLNVVSLNKLSGARLIVKMEKHHFSVHHMDE